MTNCHILSHSHAPTRAPTTRAAAPPLHSGALPLLPAAPPPTTPTRHSTQHSNNACNGIPHSEQTILSTSLSRLTCDHPESHCILCTSTRLTHPHKSTAGYLKNVNCDYGAHDQPPSSWRFSCMPRVPIEFDDQNYDGPHRTRMIMAREAQTA